MRGILFLLTLACAVQGATLTITRAEVARVEDGHPVFAPDAFRAGEVVQFSFYAEGFTRNAHEVKVSFEAQPVDPAGIPLVPFITGQTATSLTPEDKDWRPKLRGSFSLPDILGGGTCRITFRLRDDLSGESASRELPFVVSGIKFEPSAQFEVRNLHFYRTEDEERPLDVAAFRLSEDIHARFQVVGYSRGEHGAIDVVYGLTVADVAGHVLFGESSAAEDREEEFYPKPYVPGILSFSLKPGTPAGEYVLTVVAIDRLSGDRKAEAHHSFRLE